MRITVVGTGYVGLVAGAGFADFGNRVICLDLDEKKIAQLQAGHVPIYEPGLDSLIERNVRAERLTFSSSYAEAISKFEPEVVFIAVGTPQDEDGRADLTFVRAAAHEIGKALTGYAVVVNKSTVPVGTAKEVYDIILETCFAKWRFDVASNPEFLKEGTAVMDFLRPERVVLGTRDVKALKVLLQLYQPIVLDSSKILTMSPESAELTKYATNAMLATRVSFMNELARLAERANADIEDVRRAVGSDSRIGPRFLYAGAGWGGSCWEKDLKALIRTGLNHDLTLQIPRATLAANLLQKDWFVGKILDYFDQQLAGRTIAVWGLAFKPQTDDIRDATSLVLVENLLRRGASVRGYDPEAMDTFANAISRSPYAKQYTNSPDMYSAAYKADALVLVTEWHEFRRPDWGRITVPVVFDGRNVWDRTELTSRAIVYHGVGR